MEKILKYGSDYTWKKRDVPNSVSQIVADRTGMKKDLLLNDTSTYPINGMSEAINLFLKHVQKGSIIRAYCDYDTDGIDAAAILSVLSGAINVPIGIYVPKRFSDGYGIRERHVERFLDANLFILCDNGIAAKEAVTLAKKNGADVLILDHHEPQVDEDEKIVLPDADVIIDPHVTGKPGEFTEYCGAGITYRFAKEVMGRMGIAPDIQNAAIQKMVVFAAIGTVGDVVDLTYENRRLVKEGITAMLSGKTTTGMSCLLGKLGLTEYMDSMNIGFGISPVFNADGRLNDSGSSKVFSLISYDDVVQEEMEEEFEELIKINRERKRLSAEGYSRALEYIRKTGQENSPFLVVFDEECGSGIAGLVSGRLTSEFKKPSIVLGATIDPELLKGSGRSPEYADLVEILNRNKPLIAAYGGHPGACGISIRKENLEAFTKAVQSCVPEIPEEYLSNDIYYDLECPERQIPMLAKAVLKYGPYGQKNPEIVVRVDDVKLIKNRMDKTYFLLGDKKQHIKFHTKNFDIIWFDGAEKWEKLGRPETVSFLGTISLNVWRGNKTIQMQAVDLIPA